MPYEYLVPVLASSASAVISAIIGWVVYRMQKRANKMDEEEERKNEETRARERRREEDYAALKEGLQSMLRDRLIFLIQKSESDGYAQFYVLQNVNRMYDAYHKLGGNGLVSQLYERFMELPHEQEVKHDA